jgi:hypothetical protein
MTGSPDLRRSYRRLIALYPRSFRREHEEELVSVLMAGASEGQRHPRAGEIADLLVNALLAHLHRARMLPSWDYRWAMRESLAIEARHPRRTIAVRTAVGIWLLALTVLVAAFGEGEQWLLALLLVPAAALHFYLAYRLRHAVRR